MADWYKIKSRGAVEDRRGVRTGSLGTAGIVGIALLVGVNYMMGVSPLDTLSQINLQDFETQTTASSSEFEGLDSYEQFVSTVLGSANVAWAPTFSTLGYTYHEPKLVLFRNRTSSACGGASAAVGPHYCPADQTIYLDETFFDELTNTLGAQGGDVAEAYVIAHEVGHHVQNQLGLIANAETSNAASVQTELQADCLAGLWAYSIKDQRVFATNEIAEAMDAAAAVGDDRIQEKMHGQVNPESWTHGSADARVAAFTTGYTTGSPAACGIAR